MSLSDNRYQAERWLLTAEEDLRAAQTLFDAGIYAQACFLAQLGWGESSNPIGRVKTGADGFTVFTPSYAGWRLPHKWGTRIAIR
jgi:hypothetical protein